MGMKTYNRQPQSIELILKEIEAGTSNVKPVLTPRWLLSPAIMDTILADSKKRISSAKIMVATVEVRDSIIENVILFSGKCHWVGGFTEISQDMLGIVCCH